MQLGDGAAELGRHRIGIQPEPIADGFDERPLNPRRRRIGILIGIELDKAPFLGLFPGHIARHPRDMGLNEEFDNDITLSDLNDVA